MRTGRQKRTNAKMPHAQRGVVLLITLIILVAMTLAGIGMMRSVDTGNIIAGNLAFRQATANAGDAGPTAAFSLLMSLANSDNKEDKKILNFNNGQPCPAGATPTFCTGGYVNIKGYSSSPIFACEVTQTCAPALNSKLWWTDDANWNGAPSSPVKDSAGVTIATVSYLIHRMCQAPGSGPNDSGQLCQTYTEDTWGDSKSQLSPNTGTSIFYRITARSQGTRDTVAYSQTLVLIAE